ncbi:hypothetical protein ATANTOWER_013600, partial [Ataeniobius toweri]|nr:hypothetical protein [Ataeniobius toweri]
NCNGPLASALPHSSFQSSSQSSASYSAFYAKLNRRDATLFQNFGEHLLCPMRFQFIPPFLFVLNGF